MTDLINDLAVLNHQVRLENERHHQRMVELSDQISKTMTLIRMKETEDGSKADPDRRDQEG